MIKDFGTIIHYSDLDSNNYVLYLSSELDNVTYYNIPTQTEFKYPIPKGRLRKTVMEASQIFAEFLFDEPKSVNNILTLKYKYLVSTDLEKWGNDIITIDLQAINKY